MKNSLTPAGIEPATYRFVAQHLNHCATAVPRFFIVVSEIRNNSTCFGQFFRPSSGIFHFTHSNGICHTGLLTVWEQDQDGVPSWSCWQTISKPVWYILLLCVQWKTPDDGQKNCPKHVEFYSKNKCEKLVHPVGLIIRIHCVYFQNSMWNIQPETIVQLKLILK